MCIQGRSHWQRMGRRTTIGEGSWCYCGKSLIAVLDEKTLDEATTVFHAYG